MGWLGDWAERIEITVDNTNIDSDLTHFPLPLILGTSVGQNSADVSCVFDELGSSSKKIAVTKDDGTTQLYVEIELWDEANEKAVLFASKSDLTLSSASTTVLYLYYDASQPDNDTYVGETTESPAQAVWDADFVGVWHMSQDPSGGAGCIKDSTSNINHATPAGSMTADDLVDGQIGKALDFDGSDDRVIENSLTRPTSTLTLESFFNVEDSGSSYEALLSADAAQRSWQFRVDAGSSVITFIPFIGGSPVSLSGATSVRSGYHYAAANYDNGVIDIYVDGAKDRDTYNGSGSITAGTGVSIGCRGPEDASEPLDGIVDESRLSDIDRSAAWLKATYYALSDNIITWAIGATLLQDASFDLSAYYSRQEDLASFLRAHDGVELHDLTAKLEAAGWDIEDLASFLSAFYERMEDAGMDLTTWGTRYDDLKSFLAAYFQALVEDMKAGLETWATGYGDLKSMAEAAAWNTEDLAAWLCAWGQQLSSLAVLLRAGKHSFGDLAALLAVTDGIVLDDLGFFLIALDGIVLTNVTLSLKVIQAIPAFRTITAQRVASIVHEVT